ncbi:amidohydrolase family protein [Paraburkholderia terrae]|uniref:amidohydrolase family protein n=1 Tax=Paraburkholderia terrae TaxID=311230 RepID=UPI00131A2A5F|nr:amidohydrolase family protein [Paraburkholderia terrae]
MYESYYQGLPGRAGALLASGIFGWHSETAIHVLRVVLAGVFDELPGLTVIVGYMGEMLPFMLGRMDDVLMSRGLDPISETIVDKGYITTSGIFHISPFLNALTVFGADRILFSVDHPHSANAPARKFLDALPLSPADKVKIAHGNADRILKLNVQT